MVFVGSQRIFFAFTVLISSCNLSKCNAITNTSFNASERDYTVQNASNVKYVQTLQKEETGKRTFFIPVSNPVPYKEIPDTVHAGTSDSHSRFFSDHKGYDVNDYEEGSYHSYGHDYQFQDHQKHHSPHIYEHHDYEKHHYPGYHNYDHGYNKYEKVLAAKAVLWPLAGIAILGAAALAVSNPVLLQLGVVSGKRRRRDTEEITESDFVLNSLQKYTEKTQSFNVESESKIAKQKYDNLKRRIMKTESLPTEKESNEKLAKRILSISHYKDKTKVKGHRSIIKSNIDQSPKSPRRYDESYEDDRFIPIAIKLRSPNVASKPYN